MVVYSSSMGVVPTGKHRQRKGSFYTIAMHVASICAFSWTRQHAASRSVLPISVRFEGHLMCMAAIMWSIPRIQNP